MKLNFFSPSQKLKRLQKRAGRSIDEFLRTANDLDSINESMREAQELNEKQIEELLASVEEANEVIKRNKRISDKIKDFIDA